MLHPFISSSKTYQIADKSGAVAGPYTADELHSMIEAGRVDPEAQYWHEGANQWKPLPAAFGACARMIGVGVNQAPALDSPQYNAMLHSPKLEPRASRGVADALHFIGWVTLTVGGFVGGLTTIDSFTGEKPMMSSGFAIALLVGSIIQGVLLIGAAEVIEFLAKIERNTRNSGPIAKS